MNWTHNNAPLSSLTVRQFVELIHSVVREELQVNADQVSGLNNKPLYKISEVCKLFKVTPPTIYDWIRRGTLKPKKIRSRVYFLWEDIQDILKSRG